MILRLLGGARTKFPYLHEDVGNLQTQPVAKGVEMRVTGGRVGTTETTKGEVEEEVTWLLPQSRLGGESSCRASD